MNERVNTTQNLAETVAVAETIPVAVKDLTKVYGNVTAVNHITFSLKPRSTSSGSMNLSRSVVWCCRTSLPAIAAIAGRSSTVAGRTLSMPGV